MTDFILLWLQETALVTAAMAGVVALVCRVSRPRPAFEHALWVLVIVKLLVPPMVSWPEEWREAMSGVLAFVPAVREELDEAFDDTLDHAPGAPSMRTDDRTAVVTTDVDRVLETHEDLEAGDALGEASPVDEGASVATSMSGRAAPETITPEWVTPENASSASSAMEVEDASRRLRSTGAAATGTASFDGRGLSRIWSARIWLGGASLFFLLNILWILRFTRTLGTARPASPEIQSEVESLASRLGMRAPRTRLLPGAGSPLAWGLGRPTLLLPAGLVERLRHEAWRGILLHELAHLRRRDHYVGCLLVAAQCLWWWNPVFWYVRRRLGESAELACDAWVVWAAPDERRVYAESLLDVARSISRSPGRSSPLPLTTLFTSRTGRAARREFERRLTMILTGSHRRTVSRLGMSTIALFALLTVPAWSAGQASGSSDEVEPTTEEAAPLDATDDGLAVDVEAVDVGAVEDVVVVSDDAITVPVIVNVEEEVEIPVFTIDGGQEEIRVPVRRKMAQPGLYGQAVIAGDGDSPRRRIVVAGAAGDDALRASGVGPIEIPVGEDAYRGGSDRRIQRIENNIQKLERSLEAVLSELRSLRGDRSSRSDTFGGTNFGGRDSGGTAVGDATESRLRRRTSTRRGSAATESNLGSPGFSESETRSRTRSSDSGDSALVRRSPTNASNEENMSDGRSSGVRRFSRATSKVAGSSRGNIPSGPRSSRRSTASSPDSSVGGAAVVEASPSYSVTVRTLTRATYRLPDGKARALADFLEKNVTAEMEIEAKGDTVTITTSGDTQRTIERLIDILMPKKPRSSLNSLPVTN